MGDPVTDNLDPCGARWGPGDGQSRSMRFVAFALLLLATGCKGSFGSPVLASPPTIAAQKILDWLVPFYAMGVVRSRAEKGESVQVRILAIEDGHALSRVAGDTQSEQILNFLVLISSDSSPGIMKVTVENLNVRGPTLYDHVTWRIRESDDGGIEVRTKARP